MSRAASQNPHRTKGSPQGVDAVVLDWGNVLHAWDPCGAIAGRVSLRAWDDFVAGADFPALNRMLDAGRSLLEVLAALERAHPGCRDWQEILRTYWQNFDDALTGPVPGVSDLVDELLAAQVPLYGLTNFHHELFERYGRPRVPQLKRFRAVVVSGAEGLVKPDTAIFKVLIGRFDLDPGRTLFIDDSLVNIEAAASAGMRTHHFQGAGRARAALVDHGLLERP